MLMITTLKKSALDLCSLSAVIALVHRDASAHVVKLAIDAMSRIEIAFPESPAVQKAIVQLYAHVPDHREALIKHMYVVSILHQPHPTRTNFNCFERHFRLSIVYVYNFIS